MNFNFAIVILIKQEKNQNISVLYKKHKMFFFLQKKQQHCMENISYCSRWSKSFWKLYEEKKTKPRTFNCCWRHEAITNCKQQQLQVFGVNNRTKNNTCCQYYAYSTIFLQLFRFFLQILNALSMFFVGTRRTLTILKKNLKKLPI